MFTTGHLIWIGISIVLIIAGILYLKKTKPPLIKVIKICFFLGLISEFVKIFSVALIVPVVNPAVVMQNGQPVLTYIPENDYTPLLGSEHIPLELCSLQIVLMLLAILIKDEKKKQNIYAIMYPTGVIGGVFGIVFSGAASYAALMGDFFTSARMYQFFLYHSMIVVLSIYIGMCPESGLTFKKWRLALFALILMDIPTFYLNSVLSNKVYFNGELVGATHRINLFSSYVNPLGLVLTEKWQWLLYLLIRFVLALILLILVYIPFRRRPNGTA